jgi:hypothetical protein
LFTTTQGLDGAVVECAVRSNDRDAAARDGAATRPATGPGAGARRVSGTGASVTAQAARAAAADPRPPTRNSLRGKELTPRRRERLPSRLPVAHTGLVINRRWPLSVQVAVVVLFACSALLAVTSGYAMAYGIFSDDPFASVGPVVGVFLLMGAIVFFVAARTLPAGSTGAWIVSVVLALHLVVDAVTEDYFGVIEASGAAAGAVLIVSLLWRSTIRFVWDEPDVRGTGPLRPVRRRRRRWSSGPGPTG